MLDWLTIIFLLLLGLIFLVGEVFFLPGVTIMGIIGAIFSGAGIYLSYSYFGSEVGNIVLMLTVIANASALFYSLKSGVWQKFALKKSIKSKVNEDDPIYILNEGDVGTAKTTLRPVGDAEISGARFEVTSSKGLIDVGKPIKVVKIEGRKIFVEEIKSLEN